MQTRIMLPSIACAALIGCASDQPARSVGPAAPSFSATTIAGDDVSLDALAGSVVILDFWAVW